MNNHNPEADYYDEQDEPMSEGEKWASDLILILEPARAHPSENLHETARRLVTNSLGK